MMEYDLCIYLIKVALRSREYTLSYKLVSYFSNIKFNVLIKQLFVVLTLCPLVFLISLFSKYPAHRSIQ